MGASELSFLVFRVVLSGGLRWERGEEGRSIEYRNDSCSLDKMNERFRTRIVTHYYYYYYYYLLWLLCRICTMMQVKQTMSYGIQCCNCSVVTIYGTYNVIALFMSCTCWN
jgi:hypothetical protein